MSLGQCTWQYGAGVGAGEDWRSEMALGSDCSLGSNCKPCVVGTLTGLEGVDS